MTRTKRAWQRRCGRKASLMRLRRALLRGSPSSRPSLASADCDVSSITPCWMAPPLRSALTHLQSGGTTPVRTDQSFFETASWLVSPLLCRNFLAIIDSFAMRFIFSFMLYIGINLNLPAAFRCNHVPCISLPIPNFIKWCCSCNLARVVLFR